MHTGGSIPNKSDTGKRKITAESSSLNHVYAQPFAPPTLPPNAHFSQVQRILNNAAPTRPFSYMSLLTAPDDDENDVVPPSRNINDQQQQQQIDHIISLHTEKLKQALEKHFQEVNHGAEERLKELTARNAELERIVEHYKGEAERMLIRVRTLERATRGLTERLDEANAARFYADAAQEEAQSSFADPNRVTPITLECKVCERKMATVMLWPCRHVCVCTHCDATTNYCPVCRLVKTNSVEVHLPLN